MTIAALGWWVEDLLVDHLGFTRAEAGSAAESISKKARRDPVMAATTMATVALATPQLPGGKKWWTSEGAPARARVLSGRADQAERAVDRALGSDASLAAIGDEAHRTAEMLFAAAGDPET